MASLAELEALEDRIERRLTALELRHQRQIDRLQAQRDQDATSLQEVETVLHRCEQDLEVVTDWQREATARLATAETSQASAQRVEEALAAARDSAAAGEENRATAHAAWESAETRISELAARLAHLDALTSSHDDAIQKASEERAGEQNLHRTLQKTADESSALQYRLTTLDKRVTDQQEDLTDLRERWAVQEVERTEASAQIETRLTRFEGTLSNFTEEISMKAAQARVELRTHVEQQLREATSEVEACTSAAAEIRESATAEVEKLLAERSAMRNAYTRIEALRKDETWGYFLRDDADWKMWRGEITKQLVSIDEQLASLDQKHQGQDNMWTEIGRLGCRVAETHQLIDERFSAAVDLRSKGVKPSVGRKGHFTMKADRPRPRSAERPRPRSASQRRHDTFASDQQKLDAFFSGDVMRHRDPSTSRRASSPPGVVDEDEFEEQAAAPSSSAYQEHGFADRGDTTRASRESRPVQQASLGARASSSSAPEYSHPEVKKSMHFRSDGNDAVDGFSYVEDAANARAIVEQIVEHANDRPARKSLPRRLYADEDLSNLLAEA